MKKTSATLFFLIASIICSAKIDSTYVDISRLKYASEFEQVQFEYLDKNGSFNPLNFLFCLDSTTTEETAEKLKQKLNSFFESKLSPLAANKNTDKAIKSIFKEIHDNLLTKYVLESRFERLLDHGEYNCVTASALYALAFEKFNIPYQLRSTTEHVYVIANPGPSQLVIETTDPVGGAFSYNEQYKKAYIDMLVKHKSISKQELNESSLEGLFQKYFYTSDTINLKQLIGYHYYNNAVELMQNENYEQSSNQLMKAYYLNKNKQVVHLLYSVLAVQINKAFDIADSVDINRYFLFSYLYGETDYEFLYNKYLLSSEDLLVRKDDLKKYQDMSQHMFGFFDDSSQLSKFQEHFYYACAYSYYAKKKFLAAYENILNSYCLNSKNIRVNAMFEELNNHLFIYLLEEEEDGSMDSAINRIESLDKACASGNLNKWKFQMIMVKAGLAFDDGKIEKGNKFLTDAENFANENKLTDFEDRFIQMGFGGGKKHYYMQYNIPKAKEYVQRGLKLDPDNELLKSDLESLNRMGDAKKTGNNYYMVPPPPPPPSQKTYSNPTPRTVIVKTPH